jgi:hypothetical protein
LSEKVFAFLRGFRKQKDKMETEEGKVEGSETGDWIRIRDGG